jgi:hypothetical protein
MDIDKDMDMGRSTGSIICKFRMEKFKRLLQIFFAPVSGKIEKFGKSA